MLNELLKENLLAVDYRQFDAECRGVVKMIGTRCNTCHTFKPVSTVTTGRLRLCLTVLRFKQAKAAIVSRTPDYGILVIIHHGSYYYTEVIDNAFQSTFKPELLHTPVSSYNLKMFSMLSCFKVPKIFFHFL